MRGCDAGFAGLLFGDIILVIFATVDGAIFTEIGDADVRRLEPARLLMSGVSCVRGANEGQDDARP